MQNKKRKKEDTLTFMNVHGGRKRGHVIQTGDGSLT